MTTTETTATRTWKGDKATILVTLPTGATKKVGGNRAARAVAVVVSERGDKYARPGTYEVECRADIAQAQALADRHASGYTYRERRSGWTAEVAPRPFAVCVLVHDAEKVSPR